MPVEAAAEACRRRGARTVYPVLSGAELELAEDPSRPARVPASEVNLFLVPGIAFDRSGGRLGRGGGHYDRLLARRGPEAVAVGICYSDRLIENVPREPWDECVEIVVCDSATLRLDR